mmetsp:Transcript_9027/g.9666  ORF Transcript_9027/g.9666 Transcript_9027/m.9666 type:complete len:98 (-) Transcript_9027:883-1176(-)
MLDPIPLKVRDCLTELSSAQQVILRGYIGTLRADLKEKEGEILSLRDGDPNAHFHGDKMCTENQYVYYMNNNFYCDLKCCIPFFNHNDDLIVEFIFF